VELDTYFFFILGFGIAIFIYARSVSIASKEYAFKVEKKEYQRQRMLARISGRFNDFQIIEEFEELEDD
jgi:hypothetical protein